MLEQLRWKFRRYHLPIGPEALVLEVGAGSNPYPRANVVVDAYERTSERYWTDLTYDRPTILAYGEKLPFRDKTFDYVIASHVLEHAVNPSKFLDELMRVAKGGYIEVPDAFFERINPYRDHRHEISLVDNRLIIRSKQNWIVDKYLVEMYERKVKSLFCRRVFQKYPEYFHIRYNWVDKISYRVESESMWIPEKSSLNSPTILNHSIVERLRKAVLALLRYLLSQSARNKAIKIEEYVFCNKCGSKTLVSLDKGLVCQRCNQTYIRTKHGAIDCRN